MGKNRTIRTVAALLLMFALVLPAAQGVTAEEGEVQAAHLSGTPGSPIFDAADCTASADATARYFASVRSTTGVDIANAAGKLVFTGIAALLPPGTPTTINLFNGDFESQALDGNQPSCVPAVNDGHPNDLASPFVNSFPGVFTWSMVITAPGFQPVTIGLAAATDGVGNCPLGDPDPGRAGCLISIGQINLQPLGAPAGRGVVAGSIFAPNGQPLDGVTVTLTDFSGNVHTRTTGSSCASATPVAASAGTGFYCFDDSRPDVEDGLGLPPGAATLVAVNNTVANCGVGFAAVGTLCGSLPATVTVNVGAATVTGQDITVQNKFAPALAPAPAASAGAFGYVVNSRGEGVGGVTVRATTVAAGAATNVTAVTSTQTGLWTMGGLTAGTVYTFTVADAANPALSAGNVRPSLSIVQCGPIAVAALPCPAGTAPRATGPAGTWIDPSWIIVLSPGPLGVTLPVTGSAIIRGQVTDSQGQPLTGNGAFVVLYRDATRDIAGATNIVPGFPTVRQAGRATPFGFVAGGPSVIPIIAATPLDAGGNYCFGAAPATGAAGQPQTVQCAGQAPLLPDTYVVSVVDDRTVPCVPGFQPPPGGIGPAPCGQLPQSSQPVVALSDRVATVNFQLQARFSPGAIPAAPPGVPTGTTGVFGFIWDIGVPGGRPIQGQTVYAVPIPAGQGITANSVAFLNFVARVPLTGLGVLAGGVVTSAPPPIVGGILNPTFPGSDAFGLYRIFGLQPATNYAIIVEVPQGYNNCAPNNVQLGVPFQGFPFLQTGLLNPSSIIRCAVFATTPTAAAAATTPWVAGVDFGLAPQLLRPVEPGEVDRRLEHIIPLVANGAPPAALGGWDLQTLEIHVTNVGAQRTIAEVRFYASDGYGGPGVLAGTATADLYPAGGRTFRGAEIPGGFLGWVGVWSFDADGPGGIYGSSGLAVTHTNGIKNAGGAVTIESGVTREEIVSPNVETLLPLAYKNYGGTANRWSSLFIATNLGDQAPVVFQLRSQDRVRGDLRRCDPCIITRYANRGGVVALNLGDEKDPEVAYLGDGTYTVDVTGGGPILPSALSGVLPGSVAPTLPGGYIIKAIHASVPGKMATSTRGSQRLGVGGGIGTLEQENLGNLYAPLVFNGYNGWNSAIALSTGATSGAVAAVMTVSFFDEGGGFIGSYSDRVSSGSPALYLYLPSLEFLPEHFRGTAVIDASISTGTTPGFVPAGAVAAAVFHTNYERNQAMAYNAIGLGTIVDRTEALGELPCISVGFTTCAWAPDVAKVSAIGPEGGIGLITGIRMFNPDPPAIPFHIPTGQPSRVIATYIDYSGVIYDDATEVFQIPPFGVHTLFPLYNRRLPPVWRGQVRLQSSGNAIVAIANVIDYAAVGYDASGSYNLQYHTGRTE